ncbi:MAG: hypothetical protein HAW59_05300 [Betaproteobacteria bacterium]|nr:hypothetical protein [Betaproteobacteria bacterium]
MPQKGGKETAENSAGDGAAARRWALLAALMIAASALVSVQPPGKHVLSDMRYMVFALPFIIFMSAAFADWAWAKNKIAGGVLAAVLIFSHLAVRPFAVDEVHKTVFRCPTEHFPLPSLVREIHRPYPSSAGEAAAYLRKNAAQDDTIFVRPWADYAVLLYYLSDKLIFCCGLDEDAGLPREKIRALGAPVYKSDAWPTWLVLFGGATAEAIEHELFGRYRKRYEGAAFSYPTHRPELEYRCFEQNTGGPFVSIYRRVN